MATPRNKDGTPFVPASQVASAFLAFGNGGATEAQQKRVLQTILELGEIAIAPSVNDQRSDFTLGSRWLAITILALTGKQLRLHGLEDLSDGHDGSDATSSGSSG